MKKIQMHTSLKQKLNINSDNLELFLNRQNSGSPSYSITYYQGPDVKNPNI